MAIYRGSGGSVEGIIESNIVTVAINQGGTGARTAADARTNLGLGTAATTAASAYATAAQGALADSAVQPSDLGEVATTNLYSDLDGKPTLGTAAVEDVGYFATAAQGALADSATQPGDLATVATTGAYSDLTGKPTVPTNLDSLTDVVITSASTDQLLKYNGTNWVNATVGGSGTVTSVDMSVPTGLTVSGNPVTSTGTLAVTYSAGYAIPTTAKQTEWDTAYTDRNKWDGGSTGLNASTGRTSLGLGTAATTAATDYATAAQGTNADTAYGWGNHASAGYAADSAVVHDTGNETIAGVKTFSGATTVMEGNVGIGTNSPSSLLDVNGNITAAKGSSNGITIGDVSTNSNSVLRMQGTSAGKNWQIANNLNVVGLEFTPSTADGGTTYTTPAVTMLSSGNFQFNSGYGSVATAYGCRAWVNFNGTGTVAIRASGNVTSITDNGTGDYTVNFTNSMPDVNYGAFVTVNNSSTTLPTSPLNNGGQATESCRIGPIRNSGATAVDCTSVNLSIFR